MRISLNDILGYIKEKGDFHAQVGDVKMTVTESLATNNLYIVWEDRCGITADYDLAKILLRDVLDPSCTTLDVTHDLMAATEGCQAPEGPSQVGTDTRTPLCYACKTNKSDLSLTTVKSCGPCREVWISESTLTFNKWADSRTEVPDSVCYRCSMKAGHMTYLSGSDVHSCKSCLEMYPVDYRTFKDWADQQPSVNGKDSPELFIPSKQHACGLDNKNQQPPVDAPLFNCFVSETTKQCVCDMNVLVVSGCRCGGE